MQQFEFPMNEKFRKYLKVEYLFKQYDFFIKQKHNQNVANVIFQLIFKLDSFAGRADIKVELINDLQRISSKHKKFKEEAIKYKKMLEKINSFASNDSIHNKMIQELKVRSQSPALINDIDFANYKIWSAQQTTRSKNQFFSQLMGDKHTIKESIYFVLNVLRKDLLKNNLISKNMRSQIKLNPNVKTDLIIISLRDSLPFEINITANKYTVNINFMDTIDPKKIKKTFTFSASTHHI
jgi:cell division protein ZapD